MDTDRKFPCFLLMKASFPPLIPNNPLKIKSTAEIDAEKLTFVSVGPGKTVASQLVANIGSVTVQPVSAGSQRLEILLTTLARLGVFAVLIFFGMLCKNTSDPMPIDYYFLIGLAGIIVILPFSLLLSGILASRREVVRFHFSTSQGKKLLSFEVEPAQEVNVRQALLSVGLQFASGEEGQVEWQCERCGATVGADATVCPVCGDKLD